MDQADVTVKRKREEAGDEDADAGPLFSTEEQLDYEFKSEVEYDAFCMMMEATDKGRKRVDASLLRKVRRQLFLRYHSDKARDEGNRFAAVIDWIKDTFQEECVAYWQKSVDELVDEFKDESDSEHLRELPIAGCKLIAKNAYEELRAFLATQQCRENKQMRKMTKAEMTACAGLYNRDYAMYKKGVDTLEALEPGSRAECTEDLYNALPRGYFK